MKQEMKEELIKKYGDVGRGLVEILENPVFRTLADNVSLWDRGIQFPVSVVRRSDFAFFESELAKLSASKRSWTFSVAAAGNLWVLSTPIRITVTPRSSDLEEPREAIATRQPPRAAGGNGAAPG